MMKINIISDLHLEFDNYKHVCDADVTVICGDICGDADKSLSWIKQNYKDYKGVVLWVLGNHEFYHHKTFESCAKDIQASIFNDPELSKFVTLLDNDHITLEGVTFVGSTLWTDFDNNDQNRQDAQRYMNDYKVIKSSASKNQENKLVPKDTQEKFYENRDYLNRAIANKKNVIVITHHAPSYKSISSKYKRMSTIFTNPAFASDMDKFIENNPQIKAWCHGHTHSSMDYVIGKTRIVCNPKGYRDENLNFNKDLIIEIGDKNEQK